MNYKMLGRFIGKILMVEAVFMVPAMMISLWEREFAVVRAFMWTLAAILAVVGVLIWACRGSKNKFYAKEGLACVGLSWLAMSLLGCLPFFLSGVMPNFVDAFFEIVSGFTTTGASILSKRIYSHYNGCFF